MEVLKKISIKRLSYVVNFSLAYLFYIVSKWLKLDNSIKGDLWVFGSGSGLFENNVEVFLNFVIKKESENSNNRFVFISNKKVDNLPNNVVRLDRGSINAYYMCLNAKYIVLDTNDSDVCPGFLQKCGAKKVNVNHGQEGLKKLPADYYEKINVDYNCAVSEIEKEIKIIECGAKPDTVIVTGLPRYDKLFGQCKFSNDILFFPTWRPWFQTSQREKDEFVKQVDCFLSTPALQRYLKESDRVLYFKVHHMMDIEPRTSYGTNIIILQPHENLSNIIRKTSTLITDYSSVCWDYIYTKREVLFFQPDKEKYLEQVGLYNLKGKALGVTAFSVESLVNILTSEQKKVNCNSEQFFKYFDNSNCERVYNLMVKGLL
ncbi:hypothetical protein ACX02_22780 [Vibrio parahaemolyticus]|nr:CDP-glycerol glycerophosphotransferase family protein [Vibrio parahaemolyticus]KON51443.1 hypothetical protein ACX02_22780 [Vibrio parahaemolyticus]MCS0033920.1 CDP-glycerol glycerophosphotransferase family protein [Vibrio parahaemolyticus]